jgi:hypothetical protein
MKKAAPSDPRSHRKPDPAQARSAPTSHTPTFKPPLKPRPRVFYVMLGLFGVWVALLLALYFTTILPHRGESPPHQTVEPNSGAGVPR